MLQRGGPPGKDPNVVDRFQKVAARDFHDHDTPFVGPVMRRRNQSRLLPVSNLAYARASTARANPHPAIERYGTGWGWITRQSSPEPSIL
jgi:hypothetical protein